MALEVKTAKNSKLPKLPENYFDPVGKGGWPPISTRITRITFPWIFCVIYQKSITYMIIYLWYLSGLERCAFLFILEIPSKDKN
jgi:hypothetical protein